MIIVKTGKKQWQNMLGTFKVNIKDLGLMDKIVGKFRCKPYSH
jgi:hypothetical protein